MKKINSKLIAVALLAVSGLQVADAQSSVATNKRERILQVLDQSRPNEYVPAAFFLHFENKLGHKAVEDHRNFYRATGMDFVKVFYEIDYARVKECMAALDVAEHAED